MARKNKRDNDFSDWFSSVSLRQILLHPGVWFIVATCVMIGVAINFWETKRSDLIDIQKYDLSANQISVSQQPVWLTSDLREKILDEIQTPNNLLNEHLVADTARVLQDNPWIEKVQRIEKGADGLKIDLAYRMPVALVDFHQGKTKVPVDRSAVVMDKKIFGAIDPESMLHISVPSAESNRPNKWQVWDDRRIQAAAKLCDYLSVEATNLELFRVVSYRLPTVKTQDVLANEPGKPFEVWTKNGVKVIWGAVPGEKVVDEATSAEKLQAIQQFVVKQGPLSKLDRRKKIDVRSGKAIMVADVRTANLDDTNIFDELN